MFLIIPAESLLLCKVPYLQVLGIQIWTSSVGHCFAYNNGLEKIWAKADGGRNTALDQ